jgi:hypothetical protein
MNTKIIVFKRIGNHWYPDIYHDNLDDLCLNEKVEKCLSTIDKSKSGTISFSLTEQRSILYSTTIQFRDEDLNRYFTTNDDFDFIVYIGERTYPISSTLYSLLEELFNFNFHKTLYSCEIYQSYEI